MTGLSNELARDLTAHIGIASGQVVASGTGRDAYCEFTVTGESVNLSSLLQHQARSGETLISQAVQRAVSGLAECIAIGAVPVRGFSEPVHIWQAPSGSFGFTARLD